MLRAVWLEVTGLSLPEVADALRDSTGAQLRTVLAELLRDVEEALDLELSRPVTAPGLRGRAGETAVQRISLSVDDPDGAAALLRAAQDAGRPPDLRLSAAAAAPGCRRAGTASCRGTR